MFSYILLFSSSILLISPKLESKTKNYFYSIIFTSAVFAYTLLGQFSLILVSIGYSRFPILFLSFILFFLTILIDKKIKNKFIYFKKLLKSEITILRNNFNNTSNKNILLILLLLIFLITISSIGPINHPDSIDYHIGYPYQYWLRGKFFIDDGLHQPLLGIGDYANLSFIQEQSIWLIRYLQIITLPVITLFLINKTKGGFYALVLLTSPVFIQWSTIGKPLFLGESALAISYLIWKEHQDKFSRNLLIICMISCISIKISSLIILFPILIDIIFNSFKKFKDSNLLDFLTNELQSIFSNKLVIIEFLILCSIFISRQIIIGNFLFPLLTNIFNKNDILINQFSGLLSSYRRDDFFPINLFIPIKFSDISHSIGPSFLILIIFKIISLIRNQKFSNTIFLTSIVQILLLFLFCQGRGDYYIGPIIIFLYSVKDIKFKSLLSPLRNLLFSTVFLQIIVISIFLGFSIKQTILTLHDYENTMSLTSFGFSTKKYIDTNLEGNILYDIGRDARFYYPKNYISRDSMDKCLLNNDQNYCLQNLQIYQIISAENYVNNKKDFICTQTKEVKGSRNPFNRKEFNAEICIRKST